MFFCRKYLKSYRASRFFVSCFSKFKFGFPSDIVFYLYISEDNVKKWVTIIKTHGFVILRFDMESLPLSFSIYVSKRQWQITRIFDSDHQMSSKYLRALFLGYFGLLPFIVKSQDSGSITMHFDYKD